MKILINTASTFEGGAIQVAVSFIEECKYITEHEYYIIIGIKIADILRENDFPLNFHFYKIPYRPATRIFSLKSAAGFFRKLEKNINPDIVFTTSGPAYWKPKSPHICGFNIAHLVYPESSFFKIISLRRNLRWRIDRRFKRFFFRKNGSYFVVQTEDINSRLRLWLQTENVYTVSNTCSSHYFNLRKSIRKLPEKFAGEYRLLTFSTFRPHKNLQIIKSIIEILPEDYKEKIRFVLTIPNNDYEAFFAEKIKKYIYNLGPVKVDEGPGIYQECDATFLPTLLECFSAVYPESMAMRKPILTSDLSFARSICRDAALYFDPLDPKDAVNKIKQIIDSPDITHQLINSGENRLSEFGSASERAKHYLNLCERIISIHK